MKAGERSYALLPYGVMRSYRVELCVLMWRGYTVLWILVVDLLRIHNLMG